MLKQGSKRETRRLQGSIRLSLIVLTMMLSAAVSQSQRIIEKLPDRSIWVEIEGQQYLAITRAQLDSWQILQNNYDACQQNSKDKDAQIREAQLSRDLAESQKALVQQKADSFKADFERAQTDAKRNYGLFIGERQLRQEASQFIPRGNARGFWGKTLDFLNSQPAQVAFKLVIPSAQATKVFFGRCP